MDKRQGGAGSFEVPSDDVVVHDRATTKDSFYVEVAPGELRDAIDFLGHEEADLFYVMEDKPGMTYEVRKAQATKLAEKFRDPKVREKVLELAEKKRKLQTEIEATELEFHKLVGKTNAWLG